MNSRRTWLARVARFAVPFVMAAVLLTTVVFIFAESRRLAASLEPLEPSPGYEAFMGRIVTPIYEWSHESPEAEPNPAAFAQLLTWILGGMTFVALLLVIVAFLFAREVPEEDAGD